MVYSYYNFYRNNDILISYIEDAIEEKNNYAIYYKNLNDYSNNSFSRKVINDIMHDEEKHKMIFQKILQSIVGGSILQPKNVKPIRITSFSDSIKTAILNEAYGVEKYRKVLFLLEQKYHRDNLVEVLTDELKHIGLLNMLLTLNLIE